MNLLRDLIRSKLTGGGGGGEAVLIQKTITANGTFAAADDNADGYSSVTVEVPGGSNISPYVAVVGTITLAASGRITIPTPNIDSSQFCAILFIHQNYEQVANEQYALGNKVNFGARYCSFDEYYTKSGLSPTGAAKTRYGIDSTALNYYGSVSVSFGTGSVSFTNSYFPGTYDYVAIYKEQNV